jgi:hypothetical protein
VTEHRRDIPRRSCKKCSGVEAAAPKITGGTLKGIHLRRGYATAATDTGHEAEAADASWAFRHPEKVIDFGYRALHETTVNAKAIVQAFYGQPAQHAYFDSCSNGGREALIEAQRFPSDYDGILAISLVEGQDLSRRVNAAPRLVGKPKTVVFIRESYATRVGLGLAFAILSRQLADIPQQFYPPDTKLMDDVNQVMPVI